MIGIGIGEARERRMVGCKILAAEDYAYIPYLAFLLSWRSLMENRIHV